MIRVAVDASAVGPWHTGIGRYVVELVEALRRERQVEVFTRPEYDLWRGLSGWRAEQFGSSFTAFARDLVGECFRLSGRLRRGEIDVYHATLARAPLRPVGVPVVVTVHDFSAFLHPDLQGRRRGARLRAYISRAMAAARCIVVPSQSIRAELGRRFPGFAAKATAIHHGVGARFEQAPRSPPPVPTFVSVAKLERRKNLTSVVDAFATVAARHPEARLRLLGQPHNAAAAIQERLTRHRLGHAVTIEGYLDDDNVARAYAASTGLVYPSLYEGFGLPILEAMAAGAPVITSDRGAMREIAGGAALLVDPQEPGAIAAAMLRLIESPTLQAELAAAGRARAAGFTWQESARRHAAVYLAAVGVAAPRLAGAAPPAADAHG